MTQMTAGTLDASETTALEDALAHGIRALRDEAAAHRWSARRDGMTAAESQRRLYLAIAAESSADLLLSHLNELERQRLLGD